MASSGWNGSAWRLVKAAAFAGLSALVVQGPAFAAPPAGAAELTDNCTQWNVYNGMPGHPTASERTAFIARARELAVKMEAKYGVPAAALAAMSMNESGYGFTRTGMFANNYFGFKYAGQSGVEGKDYYVLKCQPPSDPNNHYIIFADDEAAFDAVAKRLATSEYYRGDTEVYKKAKANGQNVVDRVNIWLVGISNPYNGEPAVYVPKLVRLMNEPASGADHADAAANLYQLSAATGEAVVLPGSAGRGAYRAALARLSANIAGGRYLEGPDATSCTMFNDEMKGKLPAGLKEEEIAQRLPELWRSYNLGAYFSYPLKVCGYTYPTSASAPKRLEGYAVNLNATAEQLATWTETACARIGEQDSERCGAATARNMWCGNNAQFPAAGVVIELGSEAGGDEDYPVNMEFRDGVTAVSKFLRTDGKPIHWSKTKVDKETMMLSLQQPLEQSRSVARAAHAKRSDYEATGGGEDVGSVDSKVLRAKPAALNFHKANREMYLAALASDSYPLLNGWVAKTYKSGIYKDLDMDYLRKTCPAGNKP